MKKFFNNSFFSVVIILLPFIVNSCQCATTASANSNTILLIGDSITFNNGNADDPDPQPLLPGLTGYARSLFLSVDTSEQAYKRFDSETFQESGAWKTAQPGKEYPKWWSDNFGRQIATRYTSDPAGKVSFEVQAGYTFFIYRKVKDGASGILTARGASFTNCEQKSVGGTIPVNQCAVDFKAYGDYNPTEYFAHVDIYSETGGTVSLQHDSSAGTIAYFGIQTASVSNPLRIINLGRAGHNVSELSMYFENDVAPLLDEANTIVFEVPILNEINDGHTAAQIIEEAKIYIARLGNKRIIILIPHYRERFLSGDVVNADIRALYDEVEQGLRSSTYQVINVRSYFEDRAKQNGQTLQDFTKLLTTDGTHLNQAGADLYRDVLLANGIFTNLDRGNSGNANSKQINSSK